MVWSGHWFPPLGGGLGRGLVPEIGGPLATWMPAHGSGKSKLKVGRLCAAGMLFNVESSRFKECNCIKPIAYRVKVGSCSGRSADERNAKHIAYSVQHIAYGIN